MTIQVPGSSSLPLIQRSAYTEYSTRLFSEARLQNLWQPLFAGRDSFEEVLEPILGHGLEKWRVSNILSNRMSLEKDLKAFICDRVNQEVRYDNKKPDKTYIDQQDFSKVHYISLFDLEIFLRYLVLTEKIYAFAPAKLGFCVFATPHFERSDYIEVWTKEKLLDIHTYMKPVKPPIASPDFSDEEKEILNQALSRIVLGYFQRIAHYHQAALELPVVEGPLSMRVVALLLKENFISSFNVAEGTNKIYIKIYSSDFAPHVGTGRGWKWKQWKMDGEIKNS